MLERDAPWVDGLSFGQVLAATAARHADSDAVVFPWLGHRRSFAAFREDVRLVARGLLAIGIQPGDHVGIWATNLPRWIELQFATAEIGAVLVNVNPAYRSQELDYVLRQADIAALFLTNRFKSSDYFAILSEICPEAQAQRPSQDPMCNRRFANFPRLRQVVSLQSTRPPNAIGWDEFLAAAARVDASAVDRLGAAVAPDDVVNIQYTSGTTGFPKGAMLTHRNLLMNAFYVGERMAFGPRDRLCIPVPFYHCFGCVLGTLMCAVHGAAMVIPAESFDPLATLRTIQEERCTGLYGVPTMFISELSHPRFDEFDLSSLRTGVMAGSPCPIEIMKAVGERMNAREMTIGYGLTEASPIITQTATTDDVDHRVATVGRVLPGVEARVVLPGTLEAAPVGVPGELIARGHGIMKGYYNKPAETAAAIEPDGWLHSGDLAIETPDGYFRITGRIKDMIVRGGENIYPREIEEYLHSHPAILDVQIVGLPDERFGEEVCAWVRLQPNAILTEEEVRSYCRDRIAHYKVPRYVVFVDEYPNTVTGKIQKFKLRELGIERFQLAKAAAIETA